MLKLPLTDREIPVIADAYVDKEFGTGCVKITPAHDPNDFEVGKRHNLEEINILNDDGTMNNKCGKYAGMDRYECQKSHGRGSEGAGLLVKSRSARSQRRNPRPLHTTVEPMIKPAVVCKDGSSWPTCHRGSEERAGNFVPERFGKTYYQLAENIHDWCISRQLWWGHRSRLIL